jgi:selenoprotein W-related protein
VTEEVLPEVADRVAGWTLVPSGGGAFEVTVDDKLVFSKKSLGRHAEEGEVLPLVQDAL